MAQMQPMAETKSLDAATKKIVLISCGKTKHHLPTDAAHLYRGDLFTKSLAYARKLAPDDIYILSAKYGLLELDAHVEPYELTLKNLPIWARRDWARDVLINLAQKADLRSDQFIFLAGFEYRRYLEPSMAHSHAPLEGFLFGQQLSWLSQ